MYNTILFTFGIWLVVAFLLGIVVGKIIKFGGQ